MEESEDNMSSEDIRYDDSSSNVKIKPKKRSLVERELETNLTARVTSPITNSDSSSTSRYGRARRLKTDSEFYDTEKVVVKPTNSPTPKMEKSPTKIQSPVYKMHASNSPIRIETPKRPEPSLENQIENIYTENISLSRFGSEEKKCKSSTKKYPKVYIRKDLIQTKDKDADDTVVLIKNMFSPSNSSKKSNNYNYSSEKYNSITKKPNGYLNSVVKTLDFDGNKKKKSVEKKASLSKSELFDLEAKCEYQVGDLAWARMGTYPFWPCIVTRDPFSDIFVKKKLFGRIERDVLHVTFFGDNGRRGWIVDSMLRKFLGQLEFEAARMNFTPEAKKKDSRLYSAFFISEKKAPLWQVSVDEAETLLREPKRLRIDILNDMLQRSRFIKSTVKHEKSKKITRTNSDVSLSESLYDTLFSEDDSKGNDSERARSKSRNRSLNVSEVVTACLDNMAAKTGITKIQRQSHMDRWLQKAKSKTPEKSHLKSHNKVSNTAKTKKKLPQEAPSKTINCYLKSALESQPENKLMPHQNEHDYSQKYCDRNSPIILDDVEIEYENAEIFTTEAIEPGSGLGIIAKVETLCDKELIDENEDVILTVVNDEIIISEAGHNENEIYKKINDQSDIVSISRNETILEDHKAKNEIALEKPNQTESDNSNAVESMEIDIRSNDVVIENSLKSAISNDKIKDNNKNEDLVIKLNCDKSSNNVLNTDKDGECMDVSEHTDIQPYNMNEKINNDLKLINTFCVPSSDNNEKTDMNEESSIHINNINKLQLKDKDEKVKKNHFGNNYRRESPRRKSKRLKVIDPKVNDIINNGSENVVENIETDNISVNFDVSITSNKLNKHNQEDSVYNKECDKENVNDKVKETEVCKLIESEINNQDQNKINNKQIIENDPSDGEEVLLSNIKEKIDVIESITSKVKSPKSLIKFKLSLNKPAEKSNMNNKLISKNDIHVKKSENSDVIKISEESEIFTKDILHDDCAINKNNIGIDSSVSIEPVIIVDRIITQNGFNEHDIQINSVNNQNDSNMKNKSCIDEILNSSNDKSNEHIIDKQIDNKNIYDNVIQPLRTPESQPVILNGYHENDKTMGDKEVRKNIEQCQSDFVEQNSCNEDNFEADTNSVDENEIVSPCETRLTSCSPLSINITDNIIKNEDIESKDADISHNKGIEKAGIESDSMSVRSEDSEVSLGRTKQPIKENETILPCAVQLTSCSPFVTTFDNIIENKGIASKDEDISDKKGIEKSEKETDSISVKSEDSEVSMGRKKQRTKGNEKNLPCEIRLTSCSPLSITISDNIIENKLIESKDVGISHSKGIDKAEKEPDSMSVKSQDSEVSLRRKRQCVKENEKILPCDIQLTSCSPLSVTISDIINENKDIESNDKDISHKKGIEKAGKELDSISVKSEDSEVSLGRKKQRIKENEKILPCEIRSTSCSPLPVSISDIINENNDIESKGEGILDKKGIEKAEKEPDSISVKSEDSEVSVGRKKQRTKDKQDKRKILEDPEFLKYLELRQDAVMDEHPDLSQEDITNYLYKTWLYEESLKTDSKKADDIDHANLVKGQNQDIVPVKKIRKKVKVEKEKYREPKFDTEENVQKEKSKRKIIRPYYKEDFSDAEEDVEFYDIFKIKQKPKPSESLKITFLKEPNKVEGFQNEIATSEVQMEYEDEMGQDEIDQVEEYFRQLTVPKPNVFKGLIREKVCEICERIGNLVKCKGCHCMFHIDCDKKHTEVVEVPIPMKGRKKKKKTRGRKAKDDSNGLDSESHSDEKSQDANISEEIQNTSIDEEESHIVANADEFEAQLSIKMKEILENPDNLDYDSYSNDELDWNDIDFGDCKIVDIKPRTKDREENIGFSDFKCSNCQKYEIPICFVCKSSISPKNKAEYRQRCQVAHCHKYYHLECLDHWPQTQFNAGELSRTNKSNEYSEALSCPRHVCHTCVCDDPRGCKTRFSGDKLAKCVRCPATYHTFTKCLPAGTQILTGSHIICPRHYEHRPGKVPCHVNTGWCFICALGGSLICCEYCPTSFHAECLNIKPPEGGYMCEDCETGRLPLYGEMVWVKLGHYRWWPGIILHPSEIPQNILAVKHSPGEFVVRFFGQYDHYWVNRGRVFPFQEGDSGKISSQKSKIDAAFTMAMEHAQRACEILKTASPNQEESSDIASSLLPPHYVKLKVNKPCGSLCGKKIDIEESSLTQCECDPNDIEPCGPYTQCLNRMLLTECGPTCRAGDRCNNRAFEKRLYPKIVPYRTPHRGWGLKSLIDIKAGQFVIEYVGELIDEDEFKRRMRRKHEVRDENFYFLTLDKERMIDAGPKGNLARFMNHSCEPNCETQKWTVLGDVRVGLFAIYDIPVNSELTFNYNLESAGIEKKRCMCGAKRCSGYIGAKPKQDEQPKKIKLPTKRTYKKRKTIEDSPSTSRNKPKNRVGRPMKPKELTEIEKDLLIIKNATNGMSSDSECSGRVSSIDSRDAKALKRKRTNLSTEEVSSLSTKRLKSDLKSNEVE